MWIYLQTIIPKLVYLISDGKMGHKELFPNRDELLQLRLWHGRITTSHMKQGM